MKSQKGFTLIELLVVVAILGVLAAVAIPNVAKILGVGKDIEQPIIEVTAPPVYKTITVTPTTITVTPTIIITITKEK